MTWRRCVFALALAACFLPGGARHSFAASSEPNELVQAQPAPPSQAPLPEAPAPQAPAPAAAAPTAAAAEPIGNVATLTGVATLVRNKDSISLKVRDDIYLNDVVQTASDSALSITFNDATTFNLSANARIAIDNYIYEDSGKHNAAIFDIGKGTVAFVAAAVAKTGDMKITTPTAALGIRGTTGVVEVPEGAGSVRDVNIKLYPDADGRVGRIEVNDRSGARLGFLTTAASGFAIRPGAGGARFAAVPLAISPQEARRDQGFVRQVHAAQTLGRQIVTEQRAFRRANPGLNNRGNQPRQPGQPGSPSRQNGLPGQNRPGSQPGAPNRQGQQRQGTAPQPATQPQQGRLQRAPGLQQRPGAAKPAPRRAVPPRERKER